MSLANHLKAVADVFHPFRNHSTTEHQRVELHNGEVHLIANTLVVVKAKNIYWNTTKMLKLIESELSHITASRNSASCHEVVYWFHHGCYMDEHKSVQFH